MDSKKSLVFWFRDDNLKAHQRPFVQLAPLLSSNLIQTRLRPNSKASILGKVSFPLWSYRHKEECGELKKFSMNL